MEQEAKTDLVTARKVRLCLTAWKVITQDPWVLGVVKGYQLELVRSPSQINPITSVARSPSEHQAIEAEVQALLVKGAVRKVHLRSDQFTSRLFVVPKKDGSLRPVINLKPLNSHMKNQHFKMEGIHKVKELLRRGDWMCSVDLKDAYLSVPIAESHRKFLRFIWEGTTYEFTCLPFGLCSAPRIFTKLLRPVMAHLRFRGLRLVIYLDDILLMAEDRETLLKQVHQTITLLEQLGFTVNRLKSILDPCHQIIYLGLQVDTTSMTLSLPTEKMQQIINSCKLILTKESITAQELAAVIGRMSAARLAVLPAPLHTRHLQHQLIQTQKRSFSLKTKVTLSQGSLEEIQWWIHHLQEWNGRDIAHPPPDLIVRSDASLQGWGAVSNGTRTGGPWSGQEKTLHINSLELLAGSFAIRTFTKHRNNIHVLLQMDNSTAVAYVNKMGGTRSLSLSLQACHLWQWCLERRILLSAEHLPGIANTVADQESRQVETSTEWMLNRAVFHWMQQILGPCQMDLFAARLNHQLANYVSWRPDPFAQATNAFRLSWKGLDGYAFPPFGLIGKCLQKIRQEQGTITMVVPQWHSQVWYPTLMECLVDYPLSLPKQVDLLLNPSNQPHPLIIQGSLKLLACRVSGNSTLQQGFQKRLLSSYWQDGAQGQIQPISRDGQDGAAGVVNGKLIPFHAASSLS